MIEFLNLSGLFALGALLIPILLHLWNRQENRIVKVGSIRWLLQANSQAMQSSPTGTRSLRSLRLSEWLLFLLRCLMVIWVALLLAEPRWRYQQELPNWVLLSPSLLQDRALMQKTDSLVSTGYQLRLLAPGFPLYSPDKNTGSDSSQHSWSLLRELESKQALFSHALVYLPARLSDFKGMRPLQQANSPVQLALLPQRDTSTNVALFRGHALKGSTSIKVQFVYSNTRHSYFASRQYALPGEPRVLSPGGLPALEIAPQPNSVSIAMPDRPASRLELPLPKPLRVAICYDKKRSEDARYLANAVQTAAAFYELPVESLVQEISKQPVQAEVVFVLSPDAAAGVVAAQSLLLRDAPEGPWERVNTQLYMPGEEPLRLWQRVAAKAGGAVLWTDGFGQAMLKKEQKNGYRFYSRFHPDYCELATDPAFARWMMQLLFKTLAVKQEKRSISIKQAHTMTMESRSTQENGNNFVSLYVLMWYLLFATLLAERLVNYFRTS